MSRRTRCATFDRARVLSSVRGKSVRSAPPADRDNSPIPKLEYDQVLDRSGCSLSTLLYYIYGMNRLNDEPESQ